jgi:hypothetical protein
MTVRRSYHFNTTNAARKDGVYFNDPCDMHFRQTGLYTAAPYGIDADSTTRLSIGDRAGYKPNSASFPVDVIGGMHKYSRVINTTPNNVTIDDLVLLVDSTGGDRVLNLPSIATFPNKILYIYKSIKANSVILTPNGADTVEGFTGTQFTIANQNMGIMLIADNAAGQWRRLQASGKGVYLGHEYPVNPNVTINSGVYQVVRSYANVALTNRDFAAMITGSGWYNNVEFARISFAIFIDGVQGPELCYWHNQQSQNHIIFAGQGLMSNTVGLHTIDIRAKRISGANNFVMDNNDFFNFDLIQY